MTLLLPVALAVAAENPATVLDHQQEVWGYGFTAESAKQALTAGLGR